MELHWAWVHHSSSCMTAFKAAQLATAYTIGCHKPQIIMLVAYYNVQISQKGYRSLGSHKSGSIALLRTY